MSNFYHSDVEAIKEKFEFLWRDKLIHIPPLDKMTRDEYDKFKQWAWEVFIHVHNVKV